MSDLRRELHLLISIAKLDASIAEFQNELNMLPSRIDKVEGSIAEKKKSEKDALNHFDAMRKERRNLEQSLEDNGELIKKYRTQLMSVKTNKEYEAMLKEITTLETDIDEKEEKLLILMDEIEAQQNENDNFIKKVNEEREALLKQKAEMEERTVFLKAELDRLRGEKPKFLEELDPQIKRRYQRIIQKLGSYAVTRIEGDVCQGCFATIPPQTVNEVKKNDRLIICEACGRILVYYNT